MRYYTFSNDITLTTLYTVHTPNSTSGEPAQLRQALVPSKLFCDLTKFISPVYPGWYLHSCISVEWGSKQCKHLLSDKTGGGLSFLE